MRAEALTYTGAFVLRSLVYILNILDKCIYETLPHLALLVAVSYLRLNLFPT